MNRTNILTLIGSILLCLFALELFFSTVEPNSPPGTTYGKQVHTNSVGFRDRDFQIPKPLSGYRILVLGDSFTWGVGLEIEQTVSKNLERRLNERSSRRIEVLNASVPGTNTVQQLTLLKSKGLTYQPDLILLTYNLNDINFIGSLAPKVYDQAAVPVVELHPGEDITKFSENRGLRGFILKIETHSALVRFLVPRVGTLLRQLGLVNSVEFSWVAKIFQGFVDDNPGWVESKRALHEMSEVAKKRDIDLVVAIYPLLVELEDYKGTRAHMTIRNYCKSIQLHCIDLLGLFENTKARSYWINYADSHPNAKAHQLVAEFLIPAIDPYIKERKPH